MKPLNIVLTNIGPFIGTHSLDFTRLGEIFLIYGKTGSGKTTIFDSIAYAFYGEAPAGRHGLAKQMRSQFANEAAISSVVLEFLIADRKFRITRILPYDTIGIRSGKIKQVPDETALDEWKDSQWVSRSSTNKSETEKTIISLIGLTEEEFSRIILLPQGEFARFLKQNSTERKQVLAKLFPVEHYTRVIELARERAREAENRLKDSENTILELQLRFSHSEYAEQKKELEKRITQLQEEQKQLRTLLHTHTRELEKSRAYAQKKEQCTVIEQELVQLQSQENEIHACERAIDKNEKAKPLVEKNSSHESLKELLSAKNEQSIALEKSIAHEHTILEELDRQRTDIQALENEKAEQILRREKLRIAVDISQSIQTEEEQLEKYTKENHSLQKEKKAVSNEKKALLERLAIIAPDIELLAERNELRNSAHSDLERAKAVKILAEDYEREYSILTSHAAVVFELEQKIETLSSDIHIAKAENASLELLLKETEVQKQYARIALELVEKEPCPVCGSLLHPFPAQENDAVLSDIPKRLEAARRRITSLELEEKTKSSQISGAKASHRNAADSLERLHLRISEYTLDIPSAIHAAEALKKAALVIEDVTNLLAQSQRAHREAEDVRKKILSHDTALEKIKIEEAKSNTLITELQVSLRHKKDRYLEAFSSIGTQNTLQNHLEDASESLETCLARILFIEAECARYSEKRNQTQKTIATLLGNQETLLVEIQELSSEYKKSETELNLALLAAGFSSLSDVQKNILTDENALEYKRAVIQWSQALLEKKALHKSLKTELEQLVETNHSEIENRMRETEASLVIVDKSLNDDTIEYSKLESLHEQFSTLEQERAERAKIAHLYSSLSNDLTGANRYKISFDAWILGMYLEEITAYANTRLSRMSEGRYTIRVNDNYRKGNSLTGLDLEILDSYTGKARPAGTLSGGETFMTSISLALGLADSIQTRSGGIRLEAIFIDEGFGSLDEASLERAISILDEVRGHRMVGIISHVGELRNRIPSKVEICKSASGSLIKTDLQLLKPCKY